MILVNFNLFESSAAILEKGLFHRLQESIRQYVSTVAPYTWKILRSYGVPPKLGNLFYQHYECSVIIDGNLSSGFL